MACNLKIVFGDFAKTGAMAGLFDSVDAQGQLVYGITAQIGKDGKVLARASVDRDGNLTLFTGNNGDQVLASLKTDQATQKNIVEVLQKLNTGADQAGQDAETIVLTGNEQNTKKSVYVIKNPKPRARKPLGTVKVDVVDEVFFTVFVSMDGVGGEYVGDLDGAKNWLTHRLAGMGEAMSGKGLSFADTAAKLSLQIGEDLLGINDVPNPYKNATLIDLAKGVVKELVALGWESSGSTATKTIEINGQSVPLKFQFDPLAKGREIFISRDGGSSIASFGMPEMSDGGVKAKAAELNNAANEFFANQASITDEQNVQTNNSEQNFLNDVIAGNVDLLAEDTGNRIEQIGENLDPSLEALFEQAIEAYSQAALKNAQNLG